MTDADGAVTTTVYDADGNQLTVEAPSGDRTTNAWDLENQNTRVELPFDALVTYVYNAGEMRIARQDSLGVLTSFVWDAQNLLAERDDQGAVVTHYTYEPQPYGNLISQHHDAESRFYHADALGSTERLTDADEVVTDTYVYRAFGETVTASGATENPFQWVGQLGYYHDADTGRHHLRRRDYDGPQGRFLSQDPLGFDGGDENFYRYVKNNPVNAVDPSGLDERRNYFVDLLNASPFSQEVQAGWLNNYDQSVNGREAQIAFIEDRLRGRSAGCDGEWPSHVDTTEFQRAQRLLRNEGRVVVDLAWRNARTTNTIDSEEVLCLVARRIVLARSVVEDEILRLPPEAQELAWFLVRAEQADPEAIDWWIRNDGLLVLQDRGGPTLSQWQVHTPIVFMPESSYATREEQFLDEVNRLRADPLREALTGKISAGNGTGQPFQDLSSVGLFELTIKGTEQRGLSVGSAPRAFGPGTTRQLFPLARILVVTEAILTYITYAFEIAVTTVAGVGRVVRLSRSARTRRRSVPNRSAPREADDIAFGLTRAERIRLVRKRPQRYRRGVVEEVWEKAKGPDGKVRDPNTGEELFWDRTRNRDGQWEMGHRPGKSYDQLKQMFIDGEISRKQFLDEYNNPANYRPEARSANRSRMYD